MNDTQALVKLGLASDRAKRASKRLEGEARTLETAVKRALPHLVRRKIPVNAGESAPVLHGEALASLERPFHVTALRIGGHAAALVLDGKAIGHGLDGMLGAGRGEVPTLDPAGLTPAQVALATRVARGLVASFDEALARSGMRVELATEAADAQHGSVLVAATVKIGEGDATGSIVLLVSAAALDVAPDGAPPPSPTPVAATQAAVADVELEVVAELGRVRVSLARIAALRVGDVMRLPLPVDSMARLHVGGRALFSGKPTVKGSQIAVELSRHDP